LSEAQVPAPQLASPAGLAAGFFFAVALAGALAVAVAGADEDAGAAELLAAAEADADAGASVEGGLAAAAVVAGATAAGVAAGASAAFLPPQPDAEHDDCPAAPALDDVAGATSLALTGLGSLPPHATSAEAPSAASTEAKFSNERLGRMVAVLLFRW
jgi:hypothetical protein